MCVCMHACVRACMYVRSSLCAYHVVLPSHVRFIIEIHNLIRGIYNSIVETFNTFLHLYVNNNNTNADVEHVTDEVPAEAVERRVISVVDALQDRLLLGVVILVAAARRRALFEKTVLVSRVH